MAKNSKKVESSKGKKVLNGFIIFFMVVSIIGSIFLIYELLRLSSIETLIRYIVIGILALVDVFIVFRGRKILKDKPKKNKKKHKRGLFIFILIIYSIICIGIGYGIHYVYGTLSSINKKFVTYTSDLVTLTTKNYEKSTDIKDGKIAVLSDEDSPDGYIIPKEMIKDDNLEDDNEIVDYDDYTSMLADLYDGELDAMFVPSGHLSSYKEISGYENIENDTKVIASKSKKMLKSSTSKEELSSSGKSITEPFTIVLMGVDSTDEVLEKNAVANGDTLIVVTFNPQTLNATMLSIPRDSYVPIACWSDKARNKITHAAGYGTDCMLKTIENYLDTDVDYYAKINFKGFVKLIDAVGGVDINVEQTLCTDDSSRGAEICINPGYQTLDGEHALVYARNRKQLANGDFGRNEHQQEIVKALMDKVKNIKDVKTFMNIFNTVSNSVDTNLTTKQILSFYNVAKDIITTSMSADDADLINIEQLNLSGKGAMIYDKRMRMTLYNYIPNEKSRKDIVKAMHINLGKESYTHIKTFSFSINEPYEKEVIGAGPYSGGYDYLSASEISSSGGTIPSFVGDTKAQAQSYANAHGIRVTFRGTSGTVKTQSVAAGTDIANAGTVILTLSDYEEEDTTKKDDKESTNSKQDKNEDTDNGSASGEDSKNGGEQSGDDVVEPSPSNPVVVPETTENP